jgi:hypothetical protein
MIESSETIPNLDCKSIFISGVHPSGWKRWSARTAEDIVRPLWESHKQERKVRPFPGRRITPFTEHNRQVKIRLQHITNMEWMEEFFLVLHINQLTIRL